MEDRPWHKWYDEGVPTSVDYVDKPVTKFLTDTAAKHPNRTALVFENCRIPYVQLEENANRLANALAGALAWVWLQPIGGPADPAPLPAPEPAAAPPPPPEAAGQEAG